MYDVSFLCLSSLLHKQLGFLDIVFDTKLLGGKIFISSIYLHFLILLTWFIVCSSLSGVTALRRCVFTSTKSGP